MAAPALLVSPLKPSWCFDISAKAGIEHTRERYADLE